MKTDLATNQENVTPISIINQGLYPQTINPLPHIPILDSSSLAADKDMMSKILKIGIQFSDWVENIVGKEEIARYEQFLLFPQCFQKLSVADSLKWVSME